MSPPDTNIEKQEKRHRPVLRGIWLAVAVALLAIMAVLLFGPSDEVDEAPSGEPQIVD